MDDFIASIHWWLPSVICGGVEIILGWMKLREIRGRR